MDVIHLFGVCMYVCMYVRMYVCVCFISVIKMAVIRRIVNIPHGRFFRREVSCYDERVMYGLCVFETERGVELKEKWIRRQFMAESDHIS